MPHIDRKTCTSCGLCAEICVQRVFLRTAQGVAVNPAQAAACVQCGQCMAVCPTEAVQVTSFAYAEFGPMPTTPLSATTLAGFLAARRSVRNYRPDPVPRELLDALLAMAAQAPAGLPPTQLGVTVLTDPTVLARLAPAAFRQMRDLQRAMRLPLIGAWVRRSFGPDGLAILERKFLPLLAEAERALAEDGVNMVTWDAPAVLVFHAPSPGLCNQENAVIAWTYAMLAAESLGLGSCMNGIIQNLLHRDRKLRVACGMPARCCVYGALLVGYPAGRPFRRTIPRAFAQVEWR